MLGLGLLHYFEITYLFIIFVGVLCFYLIRRELRYAKEFDLIPGFRVYGLFGNPAFLSVAKLSKDVDHLVKLHQLISGFVHLFMKEKLARISIFSYHFLIIFRPQAVQDVLTNGELLDKAGHYKFFHPWVGDKCSPLACSAEWKVRRKILTPAFRYSALGGYIGVFNKHSRLAIEKLQPTVHDKFVDIRHLIRRMCFDIVCGGVVERTVLPWHWLDVIYNLTPTGKEFHRNVQILHRFIRKAIKKRKPLVEKELGDEIVNNACVDEQQKTQMTLLDFLLRHHMTDGSITEKEILEELSVMGFAGYDTVASTVSWAMFLIGHHPGVEIRIVEELNLIFGSDFDRVITMGDLYDMKYIECTIKETLRLYPGAVMFGRKILKGSIIDGYLIPKDCDSCVPINMVHLNPEHFPIPEKFDPDRFLPENSVDRHPYAFIPFCGGIRSCIGQKYAMLEAKCALAYLIRKYSVTSLDHIDKIPVAFQLVSEPVKGPRLKLTERRIYK